MSILSQAIARFNCSDADKFVPRVKERNDHIIYLKHKHINIHKMSLECDKKKWEAVVTLFGHSPFSKAVRMAKSRSCSSSESVSNMVIYNS